MNDHDHDSELDHMMTSDAILDAIMSLSAMQRSIVNKPEFDDIYNDVSQALEHLADAYGKLRVVAPVTTMNHLTGSERNEGKRR